MINQWKAPEDSEANRLTLVLPILPGQSEPYRRFLQELKESRCSDFEAACQRWGISYATVWLAPALPNAGTGTWKLPGLGDMAMIQFRPTADYADIHERFAHSHLPFDYWFKGRVREFHGVDFSTGLGRYRAELLAVW